MNISLFISSGVEAESDRHFMISQSDKHVQCVRSGSLVSPQVKAKAQSPCFNRPDFYWYPKIIVGKHAWVTC